MAPREAPKRVDLLVTLELLHEHLTEALCESVFDQVREGERRREWTLSQLAKFWTAVILRAPPSLTHALAEASGQTPGLYPQVRASDQAFFSRSQGLSWEFFAQLFEAFQARVSATEPPRFAGPFRELVGRFGAVYLVDGSTLDGVARRLKMLWKDRRVPLPGSIVAVYDFARGHLARLGFEPTPQGKELPCARGLLGTLPKGSLLVGDALYAVPKQFAALSAEGLFGLARINRTVTLRKVECLSKERHEGGLLEDWLVEAGSNARTPAQTLRWIRWKEGRRTREVLTNVLDPTRLGASEALSLYQARWTVERLFYDLKEVLNLHRFYAANTNAVAMQVYAAAIVHTALRVAQGRLAHEAAIDPEEISTEKLFPKVAAASSCLVTAKLAFLAVQRANPGVRLREPDWRTLPFATISLAAVLIEHHSGPKRRKPRCRAAERYRGLPRPPRRPRKPEGR